MIFLSMTLLQKEKNFMKEKNKIYLEWIVKAQDDEKSAKILLKEKGPAASICFHCHQIAEKLLKGYLTYRKQNFPKVHHLDFLLDICVKSDKEFLEIKNEILYLRSFYFETRYHGDYPQFTFKEANNAFRSALCVEDFILNKIKL